MSFIEQKCSTIETIFFLYLQGSVVVLGGYSDWTSAPEDADLQTDLLALEEHWEIVQIDLDVESPRTAD